jgi:nucleoside-diphosphate-sugar epimerase
VFVPELPDFDLTRAEAVVRLCREQKPEVLIHLAAVVGGIGANRAHPGRFFYENAIMVSRFWKPRACIALRRNSLLRGLASVTI